MSFCLDVTPVQKTIAVMPDYTSTAMLSTGDGKENKISENIDSRGISMDESVLSWEVRTVDNIRNTE